MCRVLLAILCLALSACSDAANLPPTMNFPTTPDWDALSFTCTREDDRLPVPDKEAEAWYREANSFHKQGMAQASEAEFASAVALLHRAAGRGHVKAMNNLVVAYRDGEGVAQSDEKAVEWAERLIKLESGRGYYHMGTFLEQGIGVRADKEKALSYFRRAADLGNAQGQLAAGRALIGAVDRSTHRDRGYPIGEAMMQCALDQGLAEAGHRLGGHLRALGEFPRALQAYQAAGRLGHGQSLWALHALFNESRPGLEADPARAALYARLSREAMADKTRTFPDLDAICPLPPAKLPGA